MSNFEKETGKKIYNILQLRVHPSIIALKNKIDNDSKEKIYDIDLTYITTRGYWYYTSWKGDIAKSGGIATNIGVHFFDMLSWIFGDFKKNIVHLNSHDRAAGFLEFKRARVRWFLSINGNTLPDEIKNIGQTTYRSITIEGKEVEFSGGFKDLHTTTYKNIISGNGFGLEASRQAIEIVHNIRHATPKGATGDYHPFVKKPLAKHPFKK